MAARWLEGVLDVVRKALASPSESPVERARLALASNQAQLDAARTEQAQAEAALAADQARALDGEVTAGELESRAHAIDVAGAKVRQLEGLGQALRAKLSTAAGNESAAAVARRWAELREHVERISDGMRKIGAGIELLLAGVKQVQESSRKAKTVAPVKPVTWPELWELPHRLFGEIGCELVRGDAVTFRLSGLSPSTIADRPRLAEQHRRAVAEVLPPDPTSRAA